MPRNGTGTYVLPSGQPVISGTSISSNVSNTLANDLAAAITASVCTDGQTPMAANLPMGNNKLVNLAAGSMAGDSVNIGQLAGGTGSVLLGFQQNAVGAAVRTVQAELRDSIRVTQFSGVVLDGSNDDTAGVQAALTATRSNGAPTNGGKALIFTKGTYKITAQLVLGSDQLVYFEPGVTINLVPAANLETTSLFVASNQANVYLYGNGAKLNGTRAGAVIEGTAAAVYMFGTDNYRIQDFNISGFATDGITIDGDNSGSGPCTNGIIENVVSDNNRRQGMSIISAKGLRVIGGMYSGTNGAPAGPWAGIDIEPNANCFMEGVVLIGVNTANNSGAGIQITPDLLATTGRRFDVTIIGGKSVNDGATSIIPGLRFVGTGAASGQTYGRVTVRDFEVDSPKGRGVGVYNWDADLSPQILLDNVGVINPDAIAGSGTNYDSTGFVIYNDSGSAVTNLGNVIMRDCWAMDTRGTPRMVWGAVLDVASGKVLKNIRIDNHKSTNFLAASKMDVSTRGTAVANAMVDVSVNYNYPSSMTSAGSQSIGDFGGKRINVTASSTQTLPAAANCAGMAFEIQCAVGINSVTVAPASTDTIRWYADVANTGLVLDSGGFVRLRSRGGTEWAVEQITGEVRRAGTTQARQTVYVTAIPSSGTWTLGDRAVNAAPSIGQPKAWACTASGSPGTWVSEGNL